MTIREILAKRDALRTELRGLDTAANGGALDAAAQTRWDAITAELATLEAQERRQATLDDLDRRAAGQHVAGTGDDQFDRMAAGVGLLDAIRAQMGGTDAAAGRAREVSAELAQRSGRRPEGIFWSMAQPMEARTLTTTTPAAGPGGNLVPTDFRPELFVDRLRNATRVRSLGATVLSGLRGNVLIPRRKASVASGWVAEDQPLVVSDPAFDGVTLTPKHAGVISGWSRQMIQQASPDVEQLARADMAAVLAEQLDVAAIAGTGTNAQPRGILNTAGIGSVSLGANGGAITYDAVADLVGQVDDANADGDSTGFLTNSKVRRALAKLKNGNAEPLGLATILQGKAAAFSNLVPNTGTKGTGTGLSSLIYGNWSDLLIGLWSELDILVNPYAQDAYNRGGVQIRAMMTVDVGVRHAESFAAITDAVA